MLYFSICSAYAAHPLVSEDNTTQGSGRNQIELNSDFASKSNVDTNTAAFTYTYGISNEVDILFNTPYTWGNTSGQSTGLNDGSVGVKWRLFENQGVSFGVKPELIVASGNENKGLGNGQNSYAYTLMLAYDLKPFTFLDNFENFGKTYTCRFSRQIDLR